MVGGRVGSFMFWAISPTPPPPTKYTRPGNVGAGMRKGRAGPCVHFQAFPSLSPTTTVPRPVGNSTELSCIPWFPTEGTPFIAAVRDLPTTLANGARPGTRWSRESAGLRGSQSSHRAVLQACPLAEAHGAGLGHSLELIHSCCGQDKMRQRIRSVRPI